MIIELLLFLLFNYLLISTGLGFDSIISKFIKSKGTAGHFGQYIISGSFFVGLVSLLVNFFSGINAPVTYVIIAVMMGFGAIKLIRFRLNAHIILGSISIIFLPWILTMQIGYDGGLYHLPYQLWLREEKIVFGLANLHGRFGFSSLQSFIQAPLWLSGDFKLLSYSVGSYFIALLIYLWQWINSRELNKIVIAAAIILSLIFFNSFILRLSTFTDNSSGILFALAFLTGFDIINKSIKGIPATQMEVFQFGFLAINAIMLKLSSIVILLWLAIVMMVVYRKNLMTVYQLFKINILNLIIFVIWILKNVINSGCLLYPLSITCVGVPWSAKDNAILDSKWITAWARHPRTEFYSLEGWGWLQNWWLEKYSSFIVEFLMIAALLVIATLILSYFLKSKPRLNYYKLLGLAVLVVACSLWFIKSPTPRFGTGVFILLPAMIAFTFFNDNNLVVRKTKVLNIAVTIFFFLGILSFSIRDTASVNFKDFFKYEPVTVPTPAVEPDENYGVRPVVRKQCWLIPHCSPYDRPKPQKIRGYLFFVPE